MYRQQMRLSHLVLEDVGPSTVADVVDAFLTRRTCINFTSHDDIFNDEHNDIDSIINID